jgi:two-component system, OmpR family, KDP operon response regulator KdpE
MSVAPPKILVVDDEPAVRRLLRMQLSAHGYQLLEATNGTRALEVLPRRPDLIILDLSLPGGMGLETLRKIRNRDEKVPIIVLLNHSDGTQETQALHSGANDCVVKPFGAEEVLSRIQAALQRLPDQEQRPIFRAGALTVDLKHKVVKVGEREVKLTPKEYELLRVFVQHAGKILTNRFLLGELREGTDDSQYVRVYVRQLRQKIETNPDEPQYLITQTGIGYRLRAPDWDLFTL